MKMCGHCGVRKELVFFTRDATRASGRRGDCRVCENARAAMRNRAKLGHLSRLPSQPSAEAHRVWMRVSADWAKAVAA